MYYNSATGQTFQARAGSSYDWSLINPGNANYIARVPTGTLNFELAGGNLIPATAAKGINFTANTPAAGKTSQLLNWYEEGTWTPSLGVNGFLSAPATTATSGTYTRMGRQVTVNMKLTFGSNTYPTTYSVVTGLPFTPATPEGVGAYTGSNPGSGVQGGVVQVNTSGQVGWWPSTGVATSANWFATVTYFV